MNMRHDPRIIIDRNGLHKIMTISIHTNTNGYTFYKTTVLTQDQDQDQGQASKE